MTSLKTFRAFWLALVRMICKEGKPWKMTNVNFFSNIDPCGDFPRFSGFFLLSKLHNQLNQKIKYLQYEKFESPSHIKFF